MPQNSVKSLRIAIDARMYGTAQRGIGRYLMRLIDNLERVDLENKYTIFLRRANFEEYQPKNPHFKKALWNAPWYGLREQLQFKPLNTVNCELKTENCVYHFPHWNVPLLFHQPFVVTIHDLELFSSNRTRQNSTRGRLLYRCKHLAFRIVFRHAVLAARAIIVPSNFVREQLLDMYPQVRKKVKVIYEAPTIVYSSQSTVHSQLKQTVNCELTTDHFVLYVGAAYPHKNLPRLLEAWKIVHNELPGYKLVLVGREDFFWKKLQTAWPHNPSQPACAGRPPLTFPPKADPPRAERGGDDRDSPLKLRGGRGSYENNGIAFYGPASDEELAALYKNAALLVQPSLEEGFSLSPLEALSFGCPIAISDIPVHREIYGSAAYYFDPLSLASIAETLKKSLKIPSQGSLPRTYSWLTHAKETKALYEGQKKV